MESHPRASVHLEKVRKNNLRIDELKLPLHTIVAFSGPSGAGKTSLLHGVFAEVAGARYEQLQGRRSVGGLDSSSAPDLDLGRISGLPFSLWVARSGGHRHTASVLKASGILNSLLSVLSSLDEFCPQCAREGNWQTLQPQSAASILSALSVHSNQSCVLQVEIPLKTWEEVEKYQASGYSRLLIDEVEESLQDLDIAQLKNSPVTQNKIFLLLDRMSVDPMNPTKAIREQCRELTRIGVEKARFRCFSSQKDLLFARPYSAGCGCLKCGYEVGDFPAESILHLQSSVFCPTCAGKGEISEFLPEALLGARSLPLLHGGIRPWMDPQLRPEESAIRAIFRLHHLDETASAHDCKDSVLQGFLFGCPENRSLHLAEGRTWKCVCDTLRDRYAHASGAGLRRKIERYVKSVECPTCLGVRVRGEVAQRIFPGGSLSELLRLPLSDLLSWSQQLASEQKRSSLSNQEFQRRKNLLLLHLHCAQDLGLGYLSGSQSFLSLSSGERQRVRLLRGIASPLTGVLFLLDEPLGGLFPSDKARVISVLNKLVERGNSVFVAENEPLLLAAVPWRCDLGPGSGAGGGRIVSNKAQVPQQANPSKDFPWAVKERSQHGEQKAWLMIPEAKGRNLKGFRVQIPVGQITAIVGPSGSGKSTLLHEVLWPWAQRERGKRGSEPSFEKVFDASRILGRLSRRSTVASYCRVSSHIKQLFLALPQTKVSGDMQQTRFRGFCYEEVMRLSVQSALEVFAHIPPIASLLRRVVAVGMGYLVLGQESRTLSDGEVQRLALIRGIPRLLFRDDVPPSLILCDEPARGLPDKEATQLIEIFRKLTKRGHTVVVAEHQEAFVQAADYLLALGPGGGKLGGQLVLEGFIASS